jgi:hypothetical protein
MQAGGYGGQLRRRLRPPASGCAHDAPLGEGTTHPLRYPPFTAPVAEAQQTTPTARGQAEDATAGLAGNEMAVLLDLLFGGQGTAHP